MPDNWRDTLAALDLDDDHDEPAVNLIQRDRHERCKRMLSPDPCPACQAPDPLISELNRDELHAIQSAALDTAMRDTGRTIREPHLTHAERQARLRGIPAIGSVGGAIKGTRPDHG